MLIPLLLGLLLLIYPWVFYPGLLRLATSLKRTRREPEPVPVGPPNSSSIAIVLAAYNEEEVIGARLGNLLECTEGLAAPIVIRVGVDGANDRTAAIVREFADREPRIRLYDFPARRGKTAVLKDLCAGAAGQPAGAPAILVFTDANTRFERETLRHLLAPLADPRIGGVCGRLLFHARAGTQTEEGRYWQRETEFKIRESRLDSCLGANGAVYAMKAALFWRSIPDNTIVDDFVLGMKVREQGYRMCYEPMAVAHEDLPLHVADEWRRRTRIGAGAFQALWLCRRCLAPRYGWFAWMFWSHKVLRWFTPHLMLWVLVGSWIATVCSAGAGAMHGIWRPGWWLALAGAGVLAGAAVGFLVRRSHAPPLRVFRVCYYFLVMQAALFMGSLRLCRGHLSGAWERTERGASQAGRRRDTGSEQGEG